VAYAGFWLRFVACILDWFVSGIGFLVLLIPIAVISGAAAALSRIDSGEDIGDSPTVFLIVSIALGFFGIMLLADWLYYALSESSSWQGTVGKRLLNLKVTDLGGQRISFARASGRYFSRIITHMITLEIGFILAGFTEKKQAVHDMIASCLVLRRI